MSVEGTHALFPGCCIARVLGREGKPSWETSEGKELDTAGLKRSNMRVVMEKGRGCMCHVMRMWHPTLPIVGDQRSASVPPLSNTNNLDFLGLANQVFRKRYYFERI